MPRISRRIAKDECTRMGILIGFQAERSVEIASGNQKNRQGNRPSLPCGQRFSVDVAGVSLKSNNQRHAEDSAPQSDEQRNEHASPERDPRIPSSYLLGGGPARELILLTEGLFGGVGGVEEGGFAEGGGEELQADG